MTCPRHATEDPHSLAERILVGAAHEQAGLVEQGHMVVDLRRFVAIKVEVFRRDGRDLEGADVQRLELEEQVAD